MGLRDTYQYNKVSLDYIKNLKWNTPNVFFMGGYLSDIIFKLKLRFKLSAKLFLDCFIVCLFVCESLPDWKFLFDRNLLKADVS